MDWQSLLWSAVPVALGVTIIWVRVKKVLKAMKEVGDILIYVPEAFEDQKLSAEERVRIRKECTEALAALKAILK